MKPPALYILREYPGLTLREACTGDGIDVWEMLREIGPGENGFGNEGSDVALSGLGAYLRRRMEMDSGVDLPDGWVPMTTSWLFHGPRPVAMCKVRHRLTESLRRVGGHIGYCVRPAERGKGYGTAVLAFALRVSRALGLRDILITVREDNRVSRRVAEANGAVFEGVRAGIAYYWIDLEDGEEVPRAAEWG